MYYSCSKSRIAEEGGFYFNGPGLKSSASRSLYISVSEEQTPGILKMLEKAFDAGKKIKGLEIECLLKHSPVPELKQYKSVKLQGQEFFIIIGPGMSIFEEKFHSDLENNVVANFVKTLKTVHVAGQLTKMTELKIALSISDFNMFHYMDSIV